MAAFAALEGGPLGSRGWVGGEKRQTLERKATSKAVDLAQSTIEKSLVEELWVKVAPLWPGEW